MTSACCLHDLVM